MMKIGLDAMGGDFAPRAAVEGAVMALEELGDDCRVVLFGDKEQIRHILASEGCAADRFEPYGWIRLSWQGSYRRLGKCRLNRRYDGRFDACAEAY